MLNSHGSLIVACLTPLALAGCINQSLPTADNFTRPTMEAFAQLSAWSPWKAEKQDPPLVIVTQNETVEAPPAPNKPASTSAVIRPEPSRPRLQAEHVVERKPLMAAPRIIPAAITAIEPAPTAPTAYSCRTVAAPGERVSIQCDPVD